MLIGVNSYFLRLIISFYKGKQAGDNPWGANTLEWQTSSPPYHENFETCNQWLLKDHEYH